MSTDNVINLGRVTGRSDLSDAASLLADAVELSQLPEYKNCKAMIVFLHNTNDEYSIKRLVAGMKSSEVLSLLECLKQITLQDMGYAK